MTFSLFYLSRECDYLSRTLLKLGMLLWCAHVPLLVCRSYGFIGYMRIVVQEHPGKKLQDLNINFWSAIFPQVSLDMAAVP